MVEPYVCPECEHRVIASDHAEMKDPAAGTGPDQEQGGGSTGVIPMDGDGYDEDDGWQSVRTRTPSQAMAKEFRTIRIPADAGRRHNRRRKEAGVTWSEYVES